jgi:hypothetical protein
MSRLHIEPYGEHFVVYDGEQFLFICETLFKAEIEMKHRLAQIEIAEKFAEHDAEIERLKTLKHPREHASDGGKENQRLRREAALLRRKQAVKLIKEAIKANKGYSRGEIVDWVLDPKKLADRWEDLEPYKESTIYAIIIDLVEDGKIDPPPDSRK